MRSIEELMDDLFECTAWFDEHGRSSDICPDACRSIVESQRAQFERDDSTFEREGFILSGLWNGDFRNAPLLVLSSNPAIRTKELSPRYFPTDGQFFLPADGRAKGQAIGSGKTARDYLINFSDELFAKHALIKKNSRALNAAWYDVKEYNNVPFWGCLRNTAEVLLPEGLRRSRYDEDYVRFLMGFVLSTEIVPFQSNFEEGVAAAMDYCWNRYAKDLIALSDAPVVVLVGKKVLDCFAAKAPGKDAQIDRRALEDSRHARLILGGKERVVVYRRFSQGRFSPLVDLQGDTLKLLRDVFAVAPAVKKL